MNYKDVKPGDFVYYVGDNQVLNFNPSNPSIRKNIPYKVVKAESSNFGLCISISSHYSVFVNYKDYITSKEYEKLKNKLKINDLKIGDIVYYKGQSSTLKKDRPYRIINMTLKTILDGDKLYSLTVKDIDKGHLYDGFISSNFISELKYKQNNSEVEEENEEEYSFDNNENTKKPKEDSIIRLQIFRDTKSGKLKWDRPYEDKPEWYRTFLRLEEPAGSYLRFDLVKVKNDWELWVYLHKNENANSITVKKMQQSNSLLRIVAKIENLLLQ